jgi:multicomponent Na+:H+ antiporter subunit D
MTKIWTEAFWKEKPETSRRESAPAVQPLSFGVSLLYHIPIVTLALLTLAIGLSAEPIFALAQQAAAQLLNPAEYIEAVLSFPKAE